MKKVFKMVWGHAFGKVAAHFMRDFGKTGQNISMVVKCLETVMSIREIIKII